MHDRQQPAAKTTCRVVYSPGMCSVQHFPVMNNLAPTTRHLGVVLGGGWRGILHRTFGVKQPCSEKRRQTINGVRYSRRGLVYSNIDVNTAVRTWEGYHASRGVIRADQTVRVHFRDTLSDSLRSVAITCYGTGKAPFPFAVLEGNRRVKRVA